MYENYKSNNSIKDYLEDKWDELSNIGKTAIIAGSIALSVFGAVKGIDAIIPDVTDVQQKEVTVVVDDVYYKAGSVSIISTGKTTSTIYSSPVYKTYVEYEGEIYSITDNLTYNQYKDKIGEKVIGNMEIKTFENGKNIYSLKSLELPETIYKLETKEGTKEYTIINIAEDRYNTTYYTDNNLEIVVKNDNSKCEIYDTSSFLKDKIEQYKDSSFSFEQINKTKETEMQIE